MQPLNGSKAFHPVQGALVLLGCATIIGALPLPAKTWCTDASVPFEKCSIDGGTRMMEEIPHIPVPIPHWWETLQPYKRQCPTCTVIWILCPAEDTGAWDGGSALRLGSQIMLEKINEQQWLLPGYELMCHYYNNNCNAKTAQKIVQGQTSLFSDKFVGVGSTGCSGVSNTLSSYTWTYNMPIISWASGAPDLSVRTTHRNFFRTVIPHTAFTFAWIQVYLACGWKKIVVIMAEEARFRGHFEMHKEETRKAGLEVAFEAQILQPLQQTQLIFRSIKSNRYRIIQVVTFENTWRAMMCSAYSLGMRDLVWLVFGVYSKGWYITLDNPDLSQWKYEGNQCGKKELRMMANNAIYAMTVMWSQKMDAPLYCDRDRTWTPQSYKDLFVARMNAELKDPQTVADRGGHAPKLGYGPAPADGVCLYAQTLAALLGTHPEGKEAPNGKKYTLAELRGRSDDVYEQFNTLLQGASFNGVGNSPLSFYCEAMPANKLCDDKCRNSAKCTGDLNGPTEIYQFDMDGKEGSHDSYASDSEFPMRQIYDRSVEATATTPAEKAKAYQWFTPFRFTYGAYYGGTDTFDTTAPKGKNGEPCVLGYHLISGTTQCVPDDMIPDVQQSSCKKYTYFDLSLKQCRGCPSGRFQLESGKTECTRCSKGYFANSSMTNCSACGAGTFADSEGLDQCGPCATGMYSMGAASSCTRCAVGSYQDTRGTSYCVTCPSRLTTRYPGATEAADCVCPEGSYLSTSQGGCTPCPEKMTCLTGSVEAHFGTEKIAPVLEAGYWSAKEDPLSVFTCIKVKDCPGGVPGSCNGGLTGRACARCPPMTTRNADRICEPCTDTSGSRIAYIFCGVLVGMGCLAFLHVFTNLSPVILVRANMNGVFLAGMAVTAVLIINIYASMDTIWGPPLSTFFEVIKVAEFDLQSVNFSCILGTDSPVASYIFKLLGVPMAFVLLVVALMILHMIPAARPYTAINKVALVNSVGLLLMIFFIVVCSNSLEGFNCSENPSPNPKYTLTSDRSILCWEGDEHTAYVALSVTALLLNPILFLSLTGFVTYYYNRWAILGGYDFIMSVRFLVNRMNPEVFYFGFWYNLRNFLLALIPVLVTGNFAVQVLGLMLVFVVWLVFQMHFQPWRFPILNYFDAFTSAVNIMLLTCFAMLAGMTSKIGTEVVGWFIIITFAITVVTLVGAGACKILMRFVTKKEFMVFLCHPKEGAGLFARLVKLMFGSCTPGKVFLDVDELENLDNLNFTVRSNTDNFLVLVTMETFGRLWCGLEIVSACMNKVPVYLARLSEDMKQEEIMPESILNSLDDLWGALELAELNKLGITLREVEESYRHISTLPSIALFMDLSLPRQISFVKDLATQMGCPLKDKVVASGIGNDAYIVYDLMNSQQAVVAKVMHLLLKDARWFSTLVSEDEPFKEDKCSTALIFMSKNLSKDPVSVGMITLLYKKGIPMITVLGQEDFPDLDKEWIDKLHQGQGLSVQEVKTVSKIAPGCSGDDIGYAQEALFKILAWRFKPQESMMLLDVEFARILERMKVTLSRGRTPPTSPRLTDSKSSRGGESPVQADPEKTWSSASGDNDADKLRNVALKPEGNAGVEDALQGERVPAKTEPELMLREDSELTEM